MAAFSRIELTIEPSVAAGLLAIIPWFLLLAFVLAAAASGKPWLLFAAPIALAGAWGQFRNNGLLRGRRAICALRLRQGRLYAELASGRELPVIPAPGCRMSARMGLLKLRSADSRFPSYSVILLASTPTHSGNVPEDEFRRLRVWLRLGRPQPASAQ